MNLGYSCGLYTLDECYKNVTLHADILSYRAIAELNEDIYNEIQEFQNEHCKLCGSQRCDGSFDFVSGCEELANYLHDKYKD